VRQVVVIGSYNIGLTVSGARIPRPGETVMGHCFDMGPGGKGSNQAIAIRRLGGKVAFIARIGADGFGRDALALFRREKISTRHLTVDPSNATGAGIIFLDSEGQNAIGVAPGANLALTDEDIENAASLFRAGDILLIQLECPVPVLYRAACRAKRAGMTVILNPAPACEIQPEFLKLCDYLTPNETEASEMTGVAVRNRATASAAARRLRDIGVGCVIITRGSKGALLMGPAGTCFTRPYSVRAVDTTGAGDAFNGAFAFALASNMPVPAAVDFASKVGAFCVTRMGVVPGLPRIEDIENRRWRHARRDGAS
jgi:ribokinase